MTLPTTIRTRVSHALATRNRRIAAALVVAALLVLTGLLMLNRPSGSEIELVAAPAGTISPSGIVHAAPGSTLSFTVTVQRAGLTPVVLDGATTLDPVSHDGATYHYAVTVTGDTAIAASFVRLADDVRLLGPGEGSDIADVSADETSVSIRAGAPILGRLAVGDILASTPASGRPEPLLVRVGAIDAGADPVRLTTERVALTEGFASASIRVIAPIELGERVPVGATRIGPAVALAETISRGIFSFDQSLSHTWSGSDGPASGSITTSGTITMSTNVDMSLELEGLSVKLFETVFREDFSGDATIEATASAEIGDDIELLNRTFSPVCVSIACFVPQVDIGASLTASANGKITVSAGFVQHARVGVHYENGAWSPVSVNTFTPRGSVDVQASASARFDPTIRVGAKLYALAGPWVETAPGFLAFGADVHANDPWWTLDGGVALSGGVEIDIPFVFNEDFGLASVELARVRLAQASGRAAIPTAAPTVTPAATPTATPTQVPTASPTATPGPTAIAPAAITAEMCAETGHAYSNKYRICYRDEPPDFTKPQDWCLSAVARARETVNGLGGYLAAMAWTGVGDWCEGYDPVHPGGDSIYVGLPQEAKAESCSAEIAGSPFDITDCVEGPVSGLGGATTYMQYTRNAGVSSPRRNTAITIRVGGHDFVGGYRHTIKDGPPNDAEMLRVATEWAKLAVPMVP